MKTLTGTLIRVAALGLLTIACGTDDGFGPHVTKFTDEAPGFFDSPSLDIADRLGLDPQQASDLTVRYDRYQNGVEAAHYRSISGETDPSELTDELERLQADFSDWFLGMLNETQMQRYQKIREEVLTKPVTGVADETDDIVRIVEYDHQ